MLLENACRLKMKVWACEILSFEFWNRGFDYFMNIDEKFLFVKSFDVVYVLELIEKIGRVSLNCVSKKLFDFELNLFCQFKDRLFNVLAIDVVAGGLPLMFNLDGEPHFPFY